MVFMATRFSSALLATLTLALAATATQAQTAPTAFPVPFTTAIAGLGSAASSTCNANILATDGTNYGDGCSGTLARLSSPQGAAVDKYGNVYVSDYSDRLVRVVYNGGTALAAAITAANSGYAISSTRNAPATVPVRGNIYTLAGVGANLTAFTVTAPDGKFACANYAASGQPEALNNMGDGCPAAAALIGPRDVNVDNDGNLIFTDYTNNRIRIMCVNCATTTLAAQLITLENPGVTPVNGYLYTVAGYTVGYRDGYLGFGNPSTAMAGVSLFRSPTASAVSSSEDIFVADNLNNAVRVLYNGGTAAKNILTAEGYTPQLGYVYTIAGSGCKAADLTHTGSTASANSCLTTTGSDTPGLGTVPGSSLTATTGGVGLNVAWTVYLDPNGNVYYTDAGNARVKVLYAGIAPPLTFPNTAYPTLQAGYAYSFAGQGALSASGVAPSQIKLSSAQGVGGDANGNIFFIDYTTGLFYETYARIGVTAIIGGGSAITTGAAGAHCSGGTTGPTMTDAYFNGCPATQVAFGSPRGPLVADASGNLYFGDSVGYFIRKLSYNGTFPATAVGSTSASQPIAFTSAALVGVPAVTEGGASGPDFSDAGNDTCPSTVAGSTCVVNVAFKPSTPGVHTGSVSTTLASATQGYTLLNGTGTGAGLTIDPATATTVGAALTPSAIAVDGGGRVYVADTASKSILRYTGGTASSVASGLTAPSGVVVDGAGNVFVADSTANTIKEVSVLGPTTFTLTTGLGSPHGLATDTIGNLYVADTGNNRIIVFGPGASTYTTAAFTGLSAPQAVAVDLSGNLYAIDTTHIVKLTPFGTQTTVASTGGTALAVDPAGNVLATTAHTLVEYPAVGGSPVTLSSALVTPAGLALDGTGSAYIADTGLTGFYELQRTAGYYKFLTDPGTTTIQLSSTGTAAVSSTAYTQSDTTDFTLAPATTNGCSGALPVGNTCALTASFSNFGGGVVTDTVTFTAPVSNGAPSLTLTNVSFVPGIAVTALPATLNYGGTETLTATVSGPSNTSGTVAFLSGTSQLASVAVNSSAMAAYSYTPGVGTYSITTTFTPTGATGPTVTSSAVSFTVKQAPPSIGLTTSTNSGYTTTSVTLNATVSATYGTPTGTVTFYAGTTSLGSSPLSGNAASLTVTNLPVGTNCITAAYSGDSNFTTVTSPCATITVAPGFAVTASGTALSFQSNYQEAQAYLTITPGGRTDTLSFACTGLPAKLSCAFSPGTLLLSGVTATQTVQMLVSNSNAQAALKPIAAPHSLSRTITLAALPIATLLLIGLRRRRAPTMLLLALLTVAGATVISGCGNSPTTVQQASGTYNFSVTVSNGSATLQTLNFTLTIPN
jgi:trimeric autotransporter adhesin